MSSQFFKLNNFDLLRLFAALQVALHHAIEIMHVDPGPILKNILYASAITPGVPIFFFISGYLISKSYEKNSKLSEYSQNRMLRLYPGLIICVTFSFLLIALSGYMFSVDAGVLDWGILYIAKTTFVQFYNPDFMRAYGDGVLNGSLWTITVELQFYVLTPIIYSIFRLKSAQNSNKLILFLIVVFFAINRFYAYIPVQYHGEVIYKLLRVSFLPWFYMFLVGIFVQKNFDFFYKHLAGKFYIVFPVYCLIGYLAVMLEVPLGNNLNPLVFLFLVITVFSFAYSFVTLGKKLLQGNDISYGAYIYHMPVINFLIYSGYKGDLSYALYAISISIVLAVISWTLIEKPSMRLKKHPLNPLNHRK